MVWKALLKLHLLTELANRRRLRRITPRDFLLGFAFIQAMPGPMFNFAGFLGVLVIPAQPILGGLLGVIAIFLPGIALKLAALPLYTRWRTSKITRSILRGLNAAAVGLVSFPIAADPARPIRLL